MPVMFSDRDVGSDGAVMLCSSCKEVTTM